MDSAEAKVVVKVAAKASVVAAKGEATVEG